MSSRQAPGGEKAQFDHIYNRPDPREYFRTLGGLDYEIPQRAQPVLQALLASLRRATPDSTEPQRVLDVCCSYGVNAALLRCEVTLAELYEHYASPALDRLSSAELARADASFYAERLRPAPVRVTGLDVAAGAVDYGCRVGLLDDGWVENLEAEDPSTGLHDELARVDLIVSTGGVGYITERTFDRLLHPQRSGAKPWVAALVLRLYPYDQIAATLARHGLQTEQLHDVTFPQRRFATDDERDAALREVGSRGLDATGREGTGRYHADLYLSRPHADVARLPLRELLADVVAPAG
ncbi:MAG: class I SAM-dependent methyltransferase [Mycobacteriales bacterium]